MSMRSAAHIANNDLPVTARSPFKGDSSTELVLEAETSNVPITDAIIVLYNSSKYIPATVELEVMSSVGELLLETTACEKCNNQ